MVSVILERLVGKGRTANKQLPTEGRVSLSVFVDQMIAGQKTGEEIACALREKNISIKTVNSLLGGKGFNCFTQTRGGSEVLYIGKGKIMPKGQRKPEISKEIVW